jgi:hypothetical protein
MKLLLDENLPHQLRLELPGHDAFTAAYMNWSGIENGQLLRLAAAAGFDAVISNDRGLEHEQNFRALPIAVVVILVKANTIESIRPVYPELIAALSRLKPCQFVKVAAP